MSFPAGESQACLEDVLDAWAAFDAEERYEAFAALSPGDAEELFLTISARARQSILSHCAPGERRRWLRLLAPDEAADVIQEAAPDERAGLIALLDDRTRREVSGLLAHEEDRAGGLMSPRFVRVRPDVTVDEALAYLRRQVRGHPETIYYVYVLDHEQRLQGVVSLRELFAAPGDALVRDHMQTDPVAVHEDDDQEAVALEIARHDLLAIPVLDPAGRMAGIVTVDDIVDVVHTEATEDIQKMAGMEALDEPYLQTGILSLLQKRGGWLAVLFVGEMLTASAMAHYATDVARAVVLTLFIPLIISSGGNSGSQATTLVIRAMALGRVRLRDWWLVLRRELLVGLGLGLLLAALGAARVLCGGMLGDSYGGQAGRLALVVGVSLIGVVTWGTLSGSMLPFLLRRLGLDPASASAPFVATLVDVFGLVIYFSVARVLFLGPIP